MRPPQERCHIHQRRTAQVGGERVGGGRGVGVERQQRTSEVKQIVQKVCIKNMSAETRIDWFHHTVAPPFAALCVGGGVGERMHVSHY